MSPASTPAVPYVLEVRSWSFANVLPYSQDAWKPADVTVHVERARTVKGVVRDPSGRPVAGAHVLAGSDDAVSVGRPTGADGTFSIGGLRPGKVGLYVSVEGRFGGHEPAVLVEAGAEDVVLTLDPGIELVVHVDNWPAGERESGEAALFEQSGREPAYATTRVAPDGSARFRGLGAGRAYTLWIAPGGGGLSLLQRDVRAAATPVHVSLTRGKSITGRLTIPSGAKLRNVMASREDGLMHVQGTAKADGTYEILGLPEGSWTVQASAAERCGPIPRRGRRSRGRHGRRGSSGAGATTSLRSTRRRTCGPRP